MMITQRRKNVYSIATRQKAVKFYESLKETGSCVVHGKEIFTITDLARSLKLKNESNLRSWATKVWDKSSVKARLAKRGKKSKLNSEQKDQLCS